VSRGYQQYRGRKSPWKAILAVLLSLIIVFAVGFIILQEKILFFDETGTPYFRLPGQEAVVEEVPQEEVDLTIEPVEEEEPVEEVRVVRGFNTPVPLDRETWSLTYRQAKDLLGETCNAVAVTLKDSKGNVYFDSAAALSGTVKFTPEDTDVALDAALSGTLHTIARISCFHDPKAANREVETMGLKNTGGYIFYDGNNSQWLDPAKPAAREYLCAIAAEAAALGFDEILLADLSYPTVGKIDKIAYGDVDRAQMLDTFLTELRAVLEPYGVVLSVELPESVILAGYDDVAGVYLDKIAQRVDSVYAAAAPENMGALLAAMEDVEFVPELEIPNEAVTGSCLIF